MTLGGAFVFVQIASVHLHTLRMIHDCKCIAAINYYFRLFLYIGQDMIFVHNPDKYHD